MKNDIFCFQNGKIICINGNFFVILHPVRKFLLHTVLVSRVWNLSSMNVVLR